MSADGERRKGRMRRRVNGCVRRKGERPTKRNKRRIGRRGSKGSRNTRLTQVMARKKGVYGEECVRCGMRGAIMSYRSELERMSECKMGTR